VTINVDPQNNAHRYKLHELLSFLRSYVEEEVRISSANVGFKLTESSVRKKKKPNMEAPVATASDLLSGGRNVGKRSRFMFCEKPHENRESFLAPKLTLSDKQKVLRRKKYCFTCLKTVRQM
jgi:hypothetical protein